LGYILGKGFSGSGYLKSLTSRQASTQASHPTHLRMSIRVASSRPLLDLADAGSGTCEAQVAQAAASEPFKKDLLDSSIGMTTPVSVKAALGECYPLSQKITAPAAKIR
jgi:hypothetical protein